MTKYVIAVAIEGPHGLCLFGRRGNSSAEYAGFWSLPTIKVSSKRLPPSVADLFSRGRLPGIRLSAIRWLDSTVRCRTKYRIEMAVFAARGESIPKNSDKYSALAMLRPQQALYRNNGVAGTCLSLYLQHLVKAGVLSPTLPYLELRQRSPTHHVRRKSSRSRNYGTSRVGTTPCCFAASLVETVRSFVDSHWTRIYPDSCGPESADPIECLTSGAGLADCSLR
jgi:hypothetical protein